MIRNVINIMIGGCDDGRTPSVQQNDYKSREFLCRLWREKDVPYELAEGGVVGALFEWRRSNGGHEYEAQIIDKSTVLVTVPGEAMKLDGHIKMQLVLYQNGTALNSPVVHFAAIESIERNEGTSNEPTMLLVALAAEAKQLVDQIKESLAKGEFQGEPGPAGKIVKVDATVDQSHGKPDVIVGYGGTPSELELYLQFTGLKGKDGLSPTIMRGGGVDEDGTKYTVLAFTAANGTEEVVIHDGKPGETPVRGVDYWTTEDVEALKKEFLPTDAGAVKNANIADRSITNAKIDYNAITNAQIRNGVIETAKLSNAAKKELTGGPYISISYDGATRADITQGKHVYALRLSDKPEINLKTWLINHATYDGRNLYTGKDIEAPLKMLGRNDFIGGIHGDEKYTDMRMIADGVDITSGAADLSGIKTLAVYITSTVYDENSTKALFTRQKVLTFVGNSLIVENRWTYIADTADKVERWPGSGLYSLSLSDTLGVTTNKSIIPSTDQQNPNREINEAAFWTNGTRVTLKALRGTAGEKYAGSVQWLENGTRIKAYLDTIYAPSVGYDIKTGDVLEGAYAITVGDVI